MTAPATLPPPADEITPEDLTAPAPVAPAPGPAPTVDEEIARQANAGSSAAARPAPPPVENPFAGLKDSRGVEFHPAKFRIKDGKPQLDSLKRFVPIGAGRRSSDPGPEGTPAAPPPPASTLPSDAPPPSEEPIAITAELSAEVAIGLVQTALIVIGEEEGELTEGECRMLRGPLVRVLQKYNLESKMTPELEFASVLAVLVMRRIKKPKTMSWFQARLAWLYAWWKSLKVRRAVPDPLQVSGSSS